MAGSVGVWAWIRQKPFAVFVIAGGLVYSGLALLVLAVPFILVAGLLGGGGFLLILLLFIAIFFVAAAFTLKEKRWAYVLGTAVTVLFFVLFSGQIVAIGSNPADDGFWLVMSLLPAYFLIIVFSVLSLKNAKTGLRQTPYLATARSTGGLLTVAVIGFVIGALIVGNIGATVILRNISGAKGDITIVSGAPTAAMAFVPQIWHVAVGGTVTWINKDTTFHTVTSNGTGPLDSPLLSTGATWSYTFTAPGTYNYHCTPHPQMWGVIVVP